MAIDPVLNPDVLTSQERWHRWEQRGRDNDERFMLQARRLFWSGVVVTAVLMVFLLS